MAAKELEHAAAAIAAAFVARGHATKPEDAAVFYFRCLHALEQAQKDTKNKRRSGPSTSAARPPASVIMNRRTARK